LQTYRFSFARAGLRAARQGATQTLNALSLPELRTCLDLFLPARFLVPEKTGRHSRQKVYSLGLTCQCWIWQKLKPKTSSREVVRRVQALFAALGRKPVRKSSSGYCQARLRFPKARLTRALQHLAQEADQRSGTQGSLCGRVVKVVDGTATQLADTPANQRAYPQSSYQRRGCGFPWMKLLITFSLSSGAVLQVTTGNRHQHDLRLFGRLWRRFQENDIILGDRIFSDYATMGGLRQQGVDVVARANVKRPVDFRKGRRLGPQDALFVWEKPSNRPPYLSQAKWAALPKTLTVRVIRFSVMAKNSRSRRITVVTTLLDPKLYPREELVRVYARRWRLELCFRDLKTQLGMEQLSARTPRMARKELLAFLLAHNLVRCVMAEASAHHDVEVEQLSFKGTVDSLRQFSQAIAQARTRRQKQHLWEYLLEIIAHDRLPPRPGRREPRALKRRPKPFPRLIVHRRQFKDPIRYDRWLRLQKTKNSALK